MTYTIVVGVNDSLPSNFAVAWASGHAATMGETAEVVLVHVLLELPDLPDATRTRIRATGRDLLRAAQLLAVQGHPSMQVRTELREGAPIDEMRSAASHADLLVIGTHKTGFIRGRAIGSRGLQIAAEAIAPIAVVPECARQSGNGIVVGVDESAGGMAALNFAGTEGERTRQAVTLLRAWDVPRTVGRDSKSTVRDLERHSAAVAEKILQHAADVISRDFPGLVSWPRRVRRPVVEALLDSAASASLLVIGESHHAPGRSPLGAVGHDVLLNLVGPTVVVHS